MVLSAVLRHSASDPEQAPRRGRPARFDRAVGFPALARYIARALGELSPALSAIPHRVLPGGDRARLSRLATAGGRLRHRGAYPHRLLFRVPAHHSAAAWAVRNDQAATGLDLGSGAAQRIAGRRTGAGAGAVRGEALGDR